MPEYIEALGDCGEGILRSEIQRLVENRVKEAFCERLLVKLASLEAQIVKVNPFFRLVRTAQSVLKGALKDLESIDVFGFRVPEFILQPIRDNLEVLDNFLQQVDDLLTELTQFVSDLITECSDGQTKDNG